VDSSSSPHKSGFKNFNIQSICYQVNCIKLYHWENRNQSSQNTILWVLFRINLSQKRHFVLLRTSVNHCCNADGRASLLWCRGKSINWKNLWEGIKVDEIMTVLYDLLFSYCSQNNLLNRGKKCQTCSFDRENIIFVGKPSGKQPLQRLWRRDNVILQWIWRKYGFNNELMCLVAVNWELDGLGHGFGILRLTS
jgi:hypothetical protein